MIIMIKMIIMIIIINIVIIMILIQEGRQPCSHDEGGEAGEGRLLGQKKALFYVAIVTFVIITIATTMIINIDDQAGKEKEKGGRRPRGA